MEVTFNNFSRRNYYVKTIKATIYTVMHFRLTDLCRILYIKGCTVSLNFLTAPIITRSLQSIRGDETVNVNKPSPVSPQLTARSGQSAQLLQVTHCLRTHVNLHSDFGHPYNGAPITWSLHDFILRAKEISRAFVYDDFLVSANRL
jgi:hypothetical protein